MADETEVLPVPKVDLEPLSRWTVGQFQTRFLALTPVNTRKAQGVDRAETKTLIDDMCEAIDGRDRALKAEVDGGTRLKRDRAGLRRALRERDETIARLNGEEPGMGGLPVRAVSEVMGATRYGEHGAELILDDARRKAGLIVADARRVEGEARALLAQAEATAAEPPPELELPPEPQSTGDVPADLAAQAAHFTACRSALEAHRQALADWDTRRQAALDRQRAKANALEVDLADQELALGERQAGFVAELDRIAAAVPEVRGRVIDLTDQSEDVKQVAS